MKNKKGFTLIELLAVIVILGLLMAIAIPSVTKYITESRKKTVVSTIGNYITAMVNEANDLTYAFTRDNTIYAVPIECIALERGGTNPLGEWHQANNSYWAYVLVQYNDDASSYRYGFTFRDSTGYGLYPTTHVKLNEQGKQIKTGLDIKRPQTGKAINITSVENWEGFVVDGLTNLVVLEVESEGNAGNGRSSCTLYQKGDNYDLVEQEKKDKWKIGREICFEEECFNIISSNSDTVTMLAKEKIDLTTTNPRQNENAESILFANDRYWVVPGGGFNLKSKYGLGYPAFIYDENSNLYQYVEAYENKLRNTGISSVSASLISIEQVNYINEKDSSGSWLDKNYIWFTGSFQNVLNIYSCANGGCGWKNYSHVSGGIRPIITVDKFEVSFN